MQPGVLHSEVVDVMQFTLRVLGVGIRDHGPNGRSFCSHRRSGGSPVCGRRSRRHACFTVDAWAFAQGAEKIVLAESLDEALALKARQPEWVALKDGPPAPGFDTVNSPGLLRSVDVDGRTVVQKTTAGTVGALAAKEGLLVLCASFVVAEATAQLLRRATATASRS